jgi:LuxR family transcriptional regulator, maltose regulon positive regulatory protein
MERGNPNRGPGNSSLPSSATHNLITAASGASRSASRSRASRSNRAVSWFTPLEAKLHAPVPRSGLIPRPRLLERLRSVEDMPLVLVTAPPGYGKTTLLSQWREADDRPFAWITLDGKENDPSELLAYLILGLGEVMSLGPEIFPRSHARGRSFITYSLPRVARAIAHGRFVLVLDDVHVLTSPESLELLGVIVQHVPAGSHVVLCGRDQPPMLLSRMLANQSLVRLGSQQLAMTSYEGLQLLHASGVPVGASEAESIVARTEGWAAGLQLAALSLREQEHLGKALETFTGSDGLVSEYLKDELLDRMPSDQLEFLLGTAVLDQLSGPLCDAVLRASGSAAKLEQLEQENVFLTRLNQKGVWYRRHQLFAEMLRSELRRRDPKRLKVQHQRASDWFDANSNPEMALSHARAAGDITRSGGVVARNLAPYISSGRATTICRWIDALPADELAAVPWFAAAAAIAYFPVGQVERATHWLAVADRHGNVEVDDPLPDGRASLRSALAISRAVLGLGGIARLEEDASLGYELELPESPWRALCAFLSGVAMHLQGRREEATARLQEAADLSAFEQASVHAQSVAQQAVIAAERGDWEQMRELSERARIEVESSPLQDYASMAGVYAVSAVSCARWRQPAQARRDATRAAKLLAPLSGMATWMNVEGWILIGEAYLLLGDVAATRDALRIARRHLTRLPDAPVLQARFDELYDTVTARSREVVGPALTAAEIRVVQYLPTHLSLGEIATRLHVSRNTVKTQVISAYRKLGVSTRTQAVESARALALIDGAQPEPNLSRAS